MRSNPEFLGVRCRVCDDVVPYVPDGFMRFCSCKQVGIDHTEHYTRFAGNPDNFIDVGLDGKDIHDPPFTQEEGDED